MAMNLNAQEQERVNNVYNEREAALAKNDEMYGGLIDQAGQLRDEQNSFLAEQERIQNETLDKQLANQQNLINQQKEEAGRTKRVESNKALNDYENFVNPYGLQAEKLASAGLGNSGVSETSKLGAWNSYQNRVATAGAAYQKAITDYDNAMNEAVLNNDVQKAQNALNKLQLQLQNNSDYYSNMSSLSQAKLQNQQQLSSDYFNRYNTVYNQIMQEQATAEAIRQYNEQMAFEKSKQQESIRQYNESLALQKQKLAEDQRQFNEQIKLSKKKVSSGSGSYSLSGSNKLSGNAKNENGVVNYYAYSSPVTFSSKKAQDWYNKEFEKHQYQKKDLDWVLNKAVKDKKITKADATKIYATYGIKA